MAKLYIHVNYKYCTIKTYEDWVTLMYPPLIQAFCFMFLYAEMQGIKNKILNDDFFYFRQEYAFK